MRKVIFLYMLVICTQHDNHLVYNDEIKSYDLHTIHINQNSFKR